MVYGGGVDLRMKMKELERETGVGRETIRFYIREGLLPEPERPKRNVATYGPEHVARLKLIRKLQQERFLPLSIIKTIVEAQAEGRPRELEAFIGLENSVGPLLAESLSHTPQRIEDVSAQTKLGVDDIRELAGFGYVTIDVRGDGEWLSRRNVRLVELVAESRAAGFTEEEASYRNEHFRIYAQMMDVVARYEVSIFYRNLASRLGSQEGAELAARGIRLVNEILPILRTEKLIREMTRVSEGGMLDEDGSEG